MAEGGRRTARQILYAVVVGGIALAGLWIILDWAQRGHELPGGGVPVTGRVIEEQPGFGGALAIVEVAYEAGGKERRARLPVPGSAAADPTVPTYRPGETVPLLVSRTDPDRVQHAGWDRPSDTPSAPVGLFVLAAAVVLTPLFLPGPRRRLQEAIAGALKNGGGRGI